MPDLRKHARAGFEMQVERIVVRWRDDDELPRPVLRATMHGSTILADSDREDLRRARVRFQFDDPAGRDDIEADLGRTRIRVRVPMHPDQQPAAEALVALHLAGRTRLQVAMGWLTDRPRVLLRTPEIRTGTVSAPFAPDTMRVHKWISVLEHYRDGDVKHFATTHRTYAAFDYPGAPHGTLAETYFNFDYLVPVRGVPPVDPTQALRTRYVMPDPSYEAVVRNVLKFAGEPKPDIEIGFVSRPDGDAARLTLVPLA